ncbi:MAG: hypothetical protein ACRESP_06975, partial [Pseudomonas sp.]
MTVSTTDSVEEYVSGGPVFPISYRFLKDSDIEAVLVKQDGTSETLVLGPQYTLTGEGSQDGGSLTSTYAAGFLAAPGATLTISRVMDAVQPTDLRNQGRYFAETHENVFDRLTMLIQQGFALLRRALLKPVGKDYYDAQGSRISNLGSPTQNQDAVPKLYNEQYIAGLLGQFSGPINNASNVMYIYPDGVARSVQTLATKNDPLLGSAGIAHNSSTVRQALIDLDTEVDQNEAEANAKIMAVRDNMTGKDLTPAIIDMHFGTLCGAGWLGNAVEIGGNFPAPTTISAPSPGGSTAIPVTDPSIFRTDQLICWMGSSTTWFSAIIKSISGSTLQLDRQLPEDVVAGAPIIYFYANDAHPNLYGYKTIADDTLRQLTRKEELAYVGKNYEIWAPYVGTETITGITLGAVTTASYKIPGTSTNSNRSAKVDVTDASQGAKSRYVALDGGLYRTHVILNSGERTGGFSGAICVSIEERLIDGT